MIEGSPRMNIHKNARLTAQGRHLLVRRVEELGWRMVEAANATLMPASYLEIDGTLLRRHAGIFDAFEIAPSGLEFLER